MTVRIDLKQTKTVESGPVYRVRCQVTYVENIPREVFVMVTETGLFSHVATVWDMQNYPTTQAQAVSDALSYYLEDDCYKDYDTLQDGLDFAALVASRVTWLARDYEDAIDTFEGVVTQTITS